MKCIDEKHGNNYSVFNIDCVELAKSMPDNSVDFIVYSPPFESLYVFSNSERDFGNNADRETFWQHYKFLISECYRVMRPGRNVAIHCMNLPTSKANDGFTGIRDFRGEIIKAHQEAGFIYHSEVCIWKDPVIAMQRTKALGLLHKQLIKDSAMSRMGIPDYVVTMRKPGENYKPVKGVLEYYVGDEPPANFNSETRNDGSLCWKVANEDGTPIDIWQRYASPIWTDINQSLTLQYQNARANEDERHISPLQLQVIERCMQLWTMPDDVVFSPFTGIGSEGHVALQMGRKFIGSELKESYFRVAAENLRQAESIKQGDLFSD